MECPICGYIMDAFTVECPRCKRMGLSPATPISRPDKSPQPASRPIVVRCQTCGRELPPGAKDCPGCSLAEGISAPSLLPNTISEVSQTTQVDGKQFVICPSCKARVWYSGQLSANSTCGICGCPVHPSLIPLRCSKCQTWNSISRGSPPASFNCYACQATLSTASNPLKSSSPNAVLFIVLIVMGLMVLGFLFSGRDVKDSSDTSPVSKSASPTDLVFLIALEENATAMGSSLTHLGTVCGSMDTIYTIVDLDAACADLLSKSIQGKYLTPPPRFISIYEEYKVILAKYEYIGKNLPSIYRNQDLAELEHCKQLMIETNEDIASVSSRIRSMAEQ